MEKYCRAGQATDDNVAHAHHMPDNKYTNSCFVIKVKVKVSRDRPRWP